MKVITDLQIHSKFSRATSKANTFPNLAVWAKLKGIDLLATGDWTHPMWFREIERDLEEVGNGLLKLKSGTFKSELQSDYNLKLEGRADPLFLLATEISSIYTQGGKGRRTHTLVWVPTIASARKINKEMTKQGCNLLSDGRPIIPLSSIQVAELVFNIEPKALVIPAHAWTPWFSMYGSKSGFDSVDEAFGPYAKQIYAVETGLSSSPDMNWRIKELDNRKILSFSDAHSGPKLGREATVFDIPDGKLSYKAIYDAIKNKSKITTNYELSTTNSIAYTIEFHPEEGKYHYTGHRSCDIRYGPLEVQEKGTGCPVCGKPLTQGVMQRVGELAGRSIDSLRLTVESMQLVENGPEINATSSKAFPNRPSFISLVPLQEIIAESIGSPVASNRTKSIYFKLTSLLASEFDILLKSSVVEIAKIAGERVAEGIEKVRSGDIVVDPGYDGVFGVVKIWGEGEKKLVDKSKEQLTIF
ncbi:endonuclease Q family protein [Patescibacteria group bacterium]